MRRPASLLLLASLLAAGAAGIALYVRTRPPTPEAAKGEVVRQLPHGGIFVEGVNMLRLYDDEGAPQWELRAKEIVYPASTNDDINIEGLQRAAYFEKGKEKLSVSAERLRLNQRTRNFEVVGSVTVTGYLGLTVTTDLVRWLHLKEQVVCPGEVRVFMKALQFRTKRVEISPKDNRLACPNEVRVAGGATLFRGKSLEANLADETIDVAGPGVLRGRVGEGKKPFSL